MLQTHSRRPDCSSLETPALLNLGSAALGAKQDCNRPWTTVKGGRPAQRREGLRGPFCFAAHFAKENAHEAQLIKGGTDARTVPRPAHSRQPSFGAGA